VPGAPACPARCWACPRTPGRAPGQKTPTSPGS